VRQFKFRAWDGENLHYINEKEELQIVFGDKNEKWSVWHPYDQILDGDDDEAVLMQFTCIYDTKSKEIYEKDIIEDHLGRGVVEYKTGAYRVNYGNGECKWFIDYLTSERKTIEVIGNIYENPELLHQTKLI
jgi:uncharacterized phage protein (TIGR01671 family)